MQNRDIRKSFEKITPDANAKVRMLHNIVNTKERKSHAKAYWALAIAVAACVLFLALPFISNTITAPTDDTYANASPTPEVSPDSMPIVIAADLPMLEVEENHGGMGFEGYMAYDIAELDNGNPWRQNMDIQTMPVYRNPIVYDRAGFPIENMLSGEEMLELAKDTAKRLGLTVLEERIYPSEEDIARMAEKGATDIRNTQTYEATVDCGEISIRVQVDGAVSMTFNYEDDRFAMQGLTPPDGYVSEPPDEYTMEQPAEHEREQELTEQQRLEYSETTMKQAKEVMPYLLNKFKDFVDMEQPKLALFGDYNIYAWRHIYYGAYEGKGSIEEQIVNYSFDRVIFSPNDKGNLWIIDRIKTDLSDKIGDYPIINAGTARELLLQGRYITTVPEAFPGGEYIAKVELMYRSSHYDLVFMPYYRFLVELPDVADWSGLTNFGAFYVPAVEERYIANMPMWQGQFN